MKDAYSNLLGEYVQAHEVDQIDVTGFQIVCPSCREEIFKVARGGENKTIDFFSHYKASAAYTVDECDRRVANLSDSEKTKTSATSRNQTLAMFRSVVRDALDVMPIGGEKFTGASLSRRHPMIVQLLPAIKERVRAWGPTGELVNLVHTNDLAIEEAGHANLTPYGLSFRNKISADLLRTIFAGDHTKTIYHIVSRGHCAAFRLKTDGRPGWIEFDFRSRTRKLADHQGLKEKHGADGGYGMTAYAVIDAMLRELHRLPYLKMIENAKNKLRPTHGLSIEDYLPDLEDLQPNVNYVSAGYDIVTMPFAGDISDLR